MNTLCEFIDQSKPVSTKLEAMIVPPQTLELLDMVKVGGSFVTLKWISFIVRLTNHGHPSDFTLIPPFILSVWGSGKLSISWHMPCSKSGIWFRVRQVNNQISHINLELFYLFKTECKINKYILISKYALIRFFVNVRKFGLISLIIVSEKRASRLKFLSKNFIRKFYHRLFVQLAYPYLIFNRTEINIRKFWIYKGRNLRYNKTQADDKICNFQILKLIWYKKCPNAALLEIRMLRFECLKCLNRHL